MTRPADWPTAIADTARATGDERAVEAVSAYRALIKARLASPRDLRAEIAAWDRTTHAINALAGEPAVTTADDGGRDSDGETAGAG